MKIASIVGARPQFIKLTPICHALKKYPSSLKHIIIHTGQHYDYNMSQIFFNELGIPRPDFHLGVGSSSHGRQTGKMLIKIEQCLVKVRPDWILVYGDTNTTLAGALAGAKMHIPVAHIEAGLRSYDRQMPEEINRIIADHCSSMLFCPTEKAVQNLYSENFHNIAERGRLVDRFCIPKYSNQQSPLVLNVGDIMLDAISLPLNLAQNKSIILQKLGLTTKEFCLATIHRAENTDHTRRLINILKALSEISHKTTVIFPVHPRTRKVIRNLKIVLPQRLRCIDPVGYFDMIILEKNAAKILTDSGGIQKEAYFLKVPCLTLREETEWPETVEAGWNSLVGFKKESIIRGYLMHNAREVALQRQKPLFGDGLTASRIMRALKAAQIKPNMPDKQIHH